MRILRLHYYNMFRLIMVIYILSCAGVVGVMSGRSPQEFGRSILTTNLEPRLQMEGSRLLFRKRTKSCRIRHGQTRLPRSTWESGTECSIASLILIFVCAARQHKPLSAHFSEKKQEEKWHSSLRADLWSVLVRWFSPAKNSCSLKSASLRRRLQCLHNPSSKSLCWKCNNYLLRKSDFKTRHYTFWHRF